MLRRPPILFSLTLANVANRMHGTDLAANTERTKKDNSYEEWYWEVFEQGYVHDRQKTWLHEKLLAILNRLVRARGRILEVGGSYGYFSAKLESRYQVICCDVSRYALGKARKITKADLVRCDANHMPLRPAIFDAVVSLETIEHMIRPDNSVGEFSRVLRKGGILLITTPNRASIAARLGGWLRIYKVTSINNPHHVSLMTASELRDVLRIKGFQRVGVTTLFRGITIPFLRGSFVPYFGPFPSATHLLALATRAR